MKMWKRFALVACLFACQLIYVPTTHGLSGGTIFKTELDAYIPIWPIWVVPYLMWMPIWLGSFCWAAWKMDPRLYKAFVAGVLVTTLSAMTCFIVFPTYIERPILTGDDWATQLLRFTYSQDGVYDAFPSGHVYVMTLFALFYSRWYPRQRWIWFGILGAITFATLFTGQHYLPDPIGGLIFGYAGYRFGLWYVERSEAAEQRARRRAALRSLR